jgi:hypothetical protein
MGRVQPKALDRSPAQQADTQQEILADRSLAPEAVGLVRDLLAAGVAVRFQVTGRSMAPALRDGERVTLEPVPAASLRRGDLVLFTRAGQLVLHRLIDVHRKAAALEFQTQGDALRSPDPPIGADQVLGRAIEIERLSSDDPRRIDLRRWPRRLGGRLAAYRLLGRRVIDWLRRLTRGD